MSIFSTPKPFKNPTLWENDVLKPGIKSYVIELLQQVYPMDKVQSLTMIGSSIGHQYSDDSDIDVNVGATKGVLYDDWHKVFKHFNERPNLLPGTKHPINFFFTEYNPKNENDWSNSLGAYDIISDRWLKKPMSYESIGDPLVKYEREIAYGNMLLSMIDSEVNAIRTAVLSANKAEQDARLKSLAKIFHQIDDNRKTAYRYQIGTPALQECNIIYKTIENSKYKDLFHEMIDAYDRNKF